MAKPNPAKTCIILSKCNSDSPEQVQQLKNNQLSYLELKQLQATSSSQLGPQVNNSLWILIQMVLVVCLVIIFWELYGWGRQSREWKSADRRLLTSEDILESSPITIEITFENIPRWYYKIKQKDEQNSGLTPIIKYSGCSKDNQPPKSKYVPNPLLDFEVIASISGQAIQLANQLLDPVKYPEELQDLQLYQEQLYEQKYQICKYQQKPFCIIVPTFNNKKADRYLHNIKSIIDQRYSNYKVVIIDDHSEDNTGELIESYLQAQKFDPSRYTLIINQQSVRALPNIRKAAKQYCKVDDIIMIVDGDDRLIGRSVFKLFNAAFHRSKAWFVYSNYVDINSKKVGYSRQLPKDIALLNSFRRNPFYTSHLRAFYNSLFLKIKQQDLQDKNGAYFQAANDVAICLPILQMSGERVFYLPEVTYGYNSMTGYNNHLIRANQQRTNDNEIRMKLPYQPLAYL